MINFLHTYLPNALLLKIGPIEIYWYGLFIVVGILSAIGLTVKLAEYYKIKKNTIIDLAFWLIIFGIIGARIYHIFLELPYYLNNPLAIFKIWEGGIAIHGALIAGIITLIIFTKKNKLNFFKLTAIITPGLALGQAIGRWGNYFNQELYGLPSNLSFAIPIEFKNRILNYISYDYFHPTFLYESIGNLIIFTILILMHVYIIKKKKFSEIYSLTIVFSYLIFYSLLRFSLEFIRIDKTPEILGLRSPQIASILIIFASIIFITYKHLKNKKQSVSID